MGRGQRRGRIPVMTAGVTYRAHLRTENLTSVSACVPTLIRRGAPSQVADTEEDLGARKSWEMPTGKRDRACSQHSSPERLELHPAGAAGGRAGPRKLGGRSCGGGGASTGTKAGSARRGRDLWAGPGVGGGLAPGRAGARPGGRGGAWGRGGADTLHQLRLLLSSSQRRGASCGPSGPGHKILPLLPALSPSKF